MCVDDDLSELFHGFSKLNTQERFERLVALGILTGDDISYLSSGGVRHIDLSEKLIENSIGYFQLPLGVATNFRIDQKDYTIPLAVEETSIIAALSKTARWIRRQGSIETRITGEGIIGQIQLANIRDFELFTHIFTENRQRLIELANKEAAANMVKRGGGVTDLTLRRVQKDDERDMAIIHLTLNSCDAMGANLINQVLEYLKEPIESLTNEKVTMCILSNLNDQKLTTAKVIINDVDPQLGHRLQEASLFAELDQYRAATHNKGVMNGIDPVLIATGNDWRAVESAMHAYACRNGRYQAITVWRYKDGILTGELTAPIIVGIVGGVTTLHPTARLCLSMMKIQSANELSRVIAAVGLVQNLGALTALCTDGIVKGHMRLHINNLLMAAGASSDELEALKERLQTYLAANKRVNLSDAQLLLDELRTQRKNSASL
ncbi:hydroxymethylglutaryl CoA reductase [Legionella birminghamensis]|uniref:3-hydroxy-3-methylglutaryl coenzyme A reductase n=1 Tax=Legionella birminghamensis TaxID=28083 RepID=A0A378I8T5_9GAMM|nr:hydroxymethylglutaryl-CoA reductase, degradative [Legionella birminghamensis]KTC69365.1 hydroxymethylglutaryl CoA reductase [Legionella birminghamensis]STX31628.1 hydroxymethylglutaryl CoA reductase [Legionella birminghamensis]